MSGATGLAAPRPIVSRIREAVANPATAYLLRAAVWFVGLLGLLRLPWVQTRLLLPYTALQAGVAERLVGEPLRVVVAVSCSGSDAMAVCLGAILAFPAPWRRRLAAAAGGLALITGVNTVRLAHLSRVADDRELLDLMHRQVWPALLILLAAGYAFAWMRAANTAGAPGEPAARAEVFGRLPAWPAVAAGAALVALYYAFHDWLLASPLVAAAAARTAWMAGGLMSACGVPATVSGGTLTASGKAWLVTPACVTTPLIPLAIAAVLVARTSWRRRLVALLALPIIFQALAVARLMVLALPRFVIGSPTIAVHAFYQMLLAMAVVIWLARRSGGALRRIAAALGGGAAVGLAAGLVDLRWLRPLAGRQAEALHLGHGYVDPQGVLLLLPAFQLGLFTALLLASGRSPIGRSEAWLGAALAAAAGVTLLALGELSAHLGIALPVVALRAWSLALPLVLVLGPRAWRRRRATAAGTVHRQPSPAA